MADELHWIPLDAPGRLATMPRPRGGDWLADDLLRFQRQGVTGIVSLLERGEEADLGLTGEAGQCRDSGLSFRSFPVADRGVPTDVAAFWSLARAVQADIRDGGSIAIHCRAGIGRASLIAAAVLGLHGHRPDEALSTISAARGLDVPDTEDQRAWFESAARSAAIHPSMLGCILLMLQNIDELSKWVAYIKPADTPWFILGSIFDGDICISHFF